MDLLTIKQLYQKKKGKYSFIIANTDSSDKSDNHWWMLSLELIYYFFYSFGVDGLKSFIIQDDKKVIEKVLLGTEQLTRTDNEITLVDTKFSLNACKNLTKNELDDLSDTARELFYFVQSFGDKLKLRHLVNL